MMAIKKILRMIGGMRVVGHGPNYHQYRHFSSAETAIKSYFYCNKLL